MTEPHNASTKFRAALRNELPLWVQQGIISEEEAGRLAALYQLSGLKDESSRLLLSVIFTIGGLLLGGGLITFVAANWQDLSDAIRLGLLFFILLGLHLTGFWLWHFRGWHRLGHALIFCGCLVFGANIALIAQIFHIPGDWYGAFGAWALGSLAMGWAVRSWIIGILVLLVSFAWFVGFQWDHRSLAHIYPVAVAFGVTTLAWVLRSRALYALSLLVIVIAVFFIVAGGANRDQIILSMVSSALFVWVLGQSHRVIGNRREFSEVTTRLGLALLAVTAYIWSFSGVWRGPSERELPSIWTFVFLALSIAGLLVIMRDRQQSDQRFVIGVLAAAALLFGSGLLTLAGFSPRLILLVATSNLAALILGSVMVGLGLAYEQRALFWLGSLYIVLLILSRFLELETSLLVKSVAFLACGVAVIVAGVRYEAYIRRKSGSIGDGRSVEVVP